MKINETFAPAKKCTAKIAIQISDLVVQRRCADGQLLRILTSRRVWSLGRFIISSVEVFVALAIQFNSLVDLLLRYILIFFIVQCLFSVNLPLLQLVLILYLPLSSIPAHFPSLACHTTGSR